MDPLTSSIGSSILVGRIGSMPTTDGFKVKNLLNLWEKSNKVHRHVQPFSIICGRFWGDVARSDLQFCSLCSFCEPKSEVWMVWMAPRYHHSFLTTSPRQFLPGERSSLEQVVMTNLFGERNFTTSQVVGEKVVPMVSVDMSDWLT